MDNTKGYVYVMINPSYEGLVKIGKTTKSPEERARELSSATGVATPFKVVYKRMFDDCNTAEMLAHNILEEKGCRVNKSREFFSIDISDAIDVVLNIPDNLASSEKSNGVLEINDAEDYNLADVYYEKGREYSYGYNDTFQDKEMAMYYFTRSSQLGNIKAYLEIGKIYTEEEKYKEAIKVFHTGAQLGDCLCYGELGKLYMNKTTSYYNRNNANLAWSKFFKMAEEYYAFDWYFRFAHYYVDFLFYSLLMKEPISLEYSESVKKRLPEVQQATEKRVEIYRAMPDSDRLVDFFEKVMQYLKEL